MYILLWRRVDTVSFHLCEVQDQATLSQGDKSESGCSWWKTDWEEGGTPPG